MAQTVREMLAELAEVQGAGYGWLNAQSYAELKQAEALQSIAEMLRLKVVGDPNYVPKPVQVPHR